MRGRSVKSWNRTRIDGGSAVSDPYPGADSRPHAQCSSSNAADGSCSLPPPPHILYSIPTFNPGSAFALEAVAAAAEQAQHLLEGTVGGAVGNSGIRENEE